MPSPVAYVHFACTAGEGEPCPHSTVGATIVSRATRTHVTFVGTGVLDGPRRISPSAQTNQAFPLGGRWRVYAGLGVAIRQNGVSTAQNEAVSDGCLRILPLISRFQRQLPPRGKPKARTNLVGAIHESPARTKKQGVEDAGPFLPCVISPSVAVRRQLPRQEEPKLVCARRGRFGSRPYRMAGTVYTP